MALSLASQVTLPAFLLVSLAKADMSWPVCSAIAGIAVLSSAVTVVANWCAVLETADVYSLAALMLCGTSFGQASGGIRETAPMTAYLRQLRLQLC